MIVAAACCLAAAGNLEAASFDNETTSELRVICDSTFATDRHFCFGFLTGAVLFYREMLRADVLEPLACPDPAPTLDAFRQNFVDWATANPQFGETRAVDGLVQATAATWPCE
jgi:hypothetical protein